MKRGQITIRAGRLASIILLILISGALLMPAAGAAGGTVNPVLPIYRASIPPLVYANGLAVTMAVDSNNVTINTPTTLQATVTYANGTPAIGATITLASTPSGIYFEKTSFKAVSSNTLVTKFQAPAEGAYTIKATATMDGYTSGSASQAVNVVKPAVPVTPTPTPTPAPTPTAPPLTPTAVASAAANNTTAAAGGFDPVALAVPVAFAVLVILLLLVIFLYLWLKSTLRITPKAVRIMADGKSAVPVKVTFVNGLGMAKKQGSDVEVEMSSTAGKIQNVTINAGRDTATAQLVSSPEFGPVAVTANAKGKTARASLEFYYEKAALEVSITPDKIPADGHSSANVVIRIKDGAGNVIAPLQERSVELKSTLGAIASPVKIPAKAQSVSLPVTSGDVSGTAVITAASGDLRGEGSIVLEGLPKRFCMHCGSSMTMEASECPKCGLIPPSGVDVKQCPTCGTVIPESAAFCYHCGARQPQAVKPTPDANVNKT